MDANSMIKGKMIGSYRYPSNLDLVSIKKLGDN
jgi:hypothetical protein